MLDKLSVAFLIRLSICSIILEGKGVAVYKMKLVLPVL